jgi:hypothetical protein
MRSPRARFRPIGLSAALATFVVAALLVSVPAPTSAQPTVLATPAQTSGGVAYTVTWNNVDVSSASTSSSALAISLSSSANLVYYWNVTSGPLSAVTISDARLQMYYLGFAVSTRDQVLSSPAPGSGHIPLSWTPISVSYLLEGVYRLTASFIAPNGTTMWSENFYIRGTAALGIAAVLPIVLLVIILYEVYGLVRSGRYAGLGRKGEGAPPATPPPSTTVPPTSSDEGAESSTPPPDSSGGTSPPTGGGS